MFDHVWRKRHVQFPWNCFIQTENTETMQGQFQKWRTNGNFCLPSDFHCNTKLSVKLSRDVIALAPRGVRSCECACVTATWRRDRVLQQRPSCSVRDAGSALQGVSVTHARTLTSAGPLHTHTHTRPLHTHTHTHTGPLSTHTHTHTHTHKHIHRQMQVQQAGGTQDLVERRGNSFCGGARLKKGNLCV